MDILQTKKRTIVDAAGKEVRLRGTCVGGWMNMEDFINGYPGTESGLRSQVKAVLGEKTGEYFFERMLDHFLAEDDLEFIAKAGGNCVRLPLNYRHFEDDEAPFVYKEKGFDRLTAMIDLCERYGLYVILDMHAAPGWQNSHWHSDNERGVSLLWTHKQFQDRLVALWEEIARRYAGRAAVAGYNLLNEPCTNTPTGDHGFDYFERYTPRWSLINSLYKRLEKAIRKIDAKHILFLDGENYSHLFEGFDPPFADNLVYGLHCYPAPGFTSQPYPGEYKAYRIDRGGVGYWDKNRHRLEFLNDPGVRFAEQYDVPLWVGEFGSQYHGPEDTREYRIRSIDDQLAAYNEWGAQWTTWTYKDVGVMGWVTLDPASEYMRIVEPVQQAKRDLGAENFVSPMGPCPGREKARVLADLILEASQNLNLNAMSNATALNYCALTGFAAATLQPTYAARFRNMTERDIDRVMEAFAFEHCVVNKAYLEVLKKRLVE